MRFWHWILRRREEDRDLREELRFHLDAETRLRMDRGEPGDSARWNARRDFGNVTLTAELTRQTWGFAALERAAQDIRFAARMLRKNGAFTVLALTALALGIGATSAVFTVVRSVLLRPLSFPDSERLVMVWEKQPGGRANVVQTQNFLDWRSRNRSFEDIAALLQFPINLEVGGEAVQLPGVRVTAGFFEILGTPAMLGRTVQAADTAPNAPEVVVLTHALWESSFGGSPEAVGRRIMLAGHPAEVIGVMPAGFAFPTMPRAALFAPLRIDPAGAPTDGRNYSTVARLRPGVSLARAQSEMEAIAAQTARERPKMNARWSATVIPLMEQTVKDSRTALFVLLGAVLFVLLIACANVSNLLLMRASTRRREMSVRLALGAGRWRLLHQLMAESLLLSAAGGLAGLLLASWGVPALIHTLPAGFPLPRMSEIRVDPSVLVFTIAVAVACGLLFGIAPALQAGRSSVAGGLRQGGRSGTGGSRPLRHALVIAEVAIAMLLVIGAGLMLRSFQLLNGTDPGFQPDRLLTVRMTLVIPPFRSLEELQANRSAIVQRMLERIRAVPGVVAASSIHLLPMLGGNSGSWVYHTDRPKPAPGTQDTSDISIVSDDYFRTMGIRILAGREFNSGDRAGAPRVAVLNQAAADHFFPGENPIGKRLEVAWGPNNIVEVVGVAGNIRHDGLATPPSWCLFMPQAQDPNGSVSLVIRTAGDPAGLAPAIREQIRAVSSGQGTGAFQLMRQLMADSIARPRLEMTLLVIFGILALALACVGIYAVISYSVEQRRREMGIRLALGAAPRGILSLVLREGLLLAAIGIVTGVLAALGMTRYLATLLYTVRPTDPAIYAVVSAILAAAAAAGCFTPARRATQVDPAVVLRDE